MPGLPWENQIDDHGHPLDPASVVDALAELLSVRPAWHRDAACRGLTAMFFGDDDDRSTGRYRVARARAICAGCPVAEQCRADAVTRGERHGVWAGMSVAELRAARHHVA